MVDTVISVEKFIELTQPLIGHVVSLPWKGIGSAIFLELGQLSPIQSRRQRHNRGQYCISVEWDWRVECGTSVLYGSSNSRPTIERGIATLLNTRIQKLCLVGIGEVPELVIHFENGHRLRSMVMVNDDPQWGIRLSQDNYLYARDGAIYVGDGRATPLTEEERFIYEMAHQTAKRWGIPQAEPEQGKCGNCSSYMPIDGNADLLEYGVCIQDLGPFDGRAVHLKSGCQFFISNGYA